MVESFLEFSKAYPIIVISVKVPKSIGHVLETLIKFDPQKI